MRVRAHHRVHAAKVAAVAVVVVVSCYVIGAVALNLVVVHRLTAEADGRIADQLTDVSRLTLDARGGAIPSVARGDGDLDDAPILLWKVGPSGKVKALSGGAPSLPRRTWTTQPVTIVIRATPFRVEAARSGSNWLIAGQSVAEIERVQSVLLLPEVILGFVLAIATFLGALVVGLRASAPLDLIRRRQAEFTADASHELRTPLSVVEAEVDLALRRRREPEEYEAVLHRIAGEGRRLHRIVEDLLWLARADDGPVESDAAATADLTAIVETCTARFQAVAESRAVTLSQQGDPSQICYVQALPEWIDRLAGVLIDNACKYAGSGGRVEVSARIAGHRVGLRVDDSGPGIPIEEQVAVFDRFHRASTETGGAGLGLAIADSVVRMTQGTWAISRSPLGGTRMEVWWRRSTEPSAPAAGSDSSDIEAPSPPSPPSPAGEPAAERPRDQGTQVQV